MSAPEKNDKPAQTPADAKPAAAPAKPPAAVVDPTKTREAREFKHESPLVSCRIDPSGRFAFAGAQDNTIQRWDLDKGTKVALKGHLSWVRALAFAPADKLLFSADYTGKILAWNLEADAPAPLRTIDAHQGWARAIAISQDGKLLASCGNDKLIKVWSVPDGKLVRSLEGHASHVYNVAFRPDGKHIVSADHEGVVKDWDLASGACVRDLDAKLLYKYDTTFGAFIGGVRSMQFSGDGSLLACGGITNVTNAFAGIGNPVAVLFDYATGKAKHVLKPKDAFQGTMWGVAFHPDGFLAGTAGGSGGSLFFWKPADPNSFFTLKLPDNARDLCLHPDGKRLAIPFYSGSLRIYEMTAKT
jgi:WD40 repeat protein